MDIGEPRPVRTAQPVSRLELSPSDAAAVRSMADRVAGGSGGAPLEARLDEISVACHELPLAIRQALVDLRLSVTRSGGLVLSGFEVVDDELGPTPVREATTDRSELTRADALLLLVASFMGDVISHAGIEDGRVIRDLCPLPGDENTQLGSSSAGELTWHIEDAFHDLRADWILLFCLRNPGRAATSFARVQDVALSDEIRSILFEERFLVSPDNSHVDGAMAPADRRTAILTGDLRAPFVRLDPAFMPKPPDDPAAQEALSTVIDAFDQSLQDIVLAPGDLFIIDNLRAVHGRRPFQASYDGRDRWLRVAHSVADLRKSAGRRTGWHGRAILEQL